MHNKTKVEMVLVNRSCTQFCIVKQLENKVFNRTITMGQNIVKNMGCQTGKPTCQLHCI